MSALKHGAHVVQLPGGPTKNQQATRTYPTTVRQTELLLRGALPQNGTMQAHAGKEAMKRAT